MAFRLFRKRKKERTAQTIVRSKLGKAFHRLESACVAYLQKQEKRWSTRQKKCLLWLFFIVFGGISLYTLTDAITSPFSSPVKTSYTAKPFPRPQPVPHFREARFNQQDSMAVRQLRHLLDSLSATEKGRQEIDSFSRLRPGFLDSFYQLEKIIIQP